MWNIATATAVYSGVTNEGIGFAVACLARCRKCVWISLQSS